ncbi:MAG TPA: PadR family transcriptional regulator [Streptosporangiaceae bacterium]|jgi:DNA-binding PadR family transcriptional regulator
MAGVPRMTLQVQLVARALLEAGEAESYGLQLCAVTGLPSGTVYPIIARLEQAGWLDSWWEDPVRHTAEGRPRRRYYRLSQDGAETARLALARSYRSRSGAVPGWGVAIPGGSGASS